MDSIKVNGNVYHIDCISFEDKSEPDEDGYYEYFYKGIYITFRLDKGIFKARIYEGEEIISFFKNPLLTFGQDFEALKAYLIEKFCVKRFKYLDSEKGYGYIEL